MGCRGIGIRKSEFVAKTQFLCTNFEDTKMVDHILKISRPGVFDVGDLSWNTAIIVFMKKCRMN